jgi:hypothetical protein
LIIVIQFRVSELAADGWGIKDEEQNHFLEANGFNTTAPEGI